MYFTVPRCLWHINFQICLYCRRYVNLLANLRGYKSKYYELAFLWAEREEKHAGKQTQADVNIPFCHSLEKFYLRMFWARLLRPDTTSYWSPTLPNNSPHGLVKTLGQEEAMPPAALRPWNPCNTTEVSRSLALSVCWLFSPRTPVLVGSLEGSPTRSPGRWRERHRCKRS